MPQGARDSKPRAWTTDAILALIEPQIKRMIRKALFGAGIGGGTLDHGTLDGLSDDDHAQYILDDAASGGDGIDVTSRVVTADIDNLDAIGTVVPATDTLMIWDDDLSLLKKVIPNNLGIVGTSLVQLIVSATMSANVNIDQATWTKMEFNTESIDVNDEFNTTTFTFTPNNTGVYLISLSGSIDDINDATHGQLGLFIDAGLGEVLFIQHIHQHSRDGIVVALNYSVIVPLSAGDDVTFQMRHSTIGTQIIVAAGGAPASLQIVRLT